MKGELKAGGLALVYGLRVHVEKNGKSVRLIEIAPYRNAELMAAIMGEPVAQWWRVTGLLPGNEVSQVKAENLLPIDGDDDQAPQEREADKPREVMAKWENWLHSALE